MNEPLVSVVIPLFNKKEYISATLECVIAQTYRNIELIVIDDESTDQSLEVVRSVMNRSLGRFSNVQIHSQKNAGQTAARTKGVGFSKGDYVAFLDADDIWHPNKISSQIKYLENHTSVDLVFCNYFIFSGLGSKGRAVKLSPISKKIEDWILLKSYGVGLESTGVVRKKALLQIGGFDPNLQMCGGMDLAFRFSINNRVGCVDQYLVAYRMVSNGWHNNKRDLVLDYETLMNNRNLYGKLEFEARKLLSVHLSLWNVRFKFDKRNFTILIMNLIRNPRYFANYSLATIIRMVFASIRGHIHHHKLVQMRRFLCS